LHQLPVQVGEKPGAGIDKGEHKGCIDPASSLISTGVRA